MNDAEFIKERIEALRASIAFYSPKNKPERELWTARAFLKNLPVRFSKKDTAWI